MMYGCKSRVLREMEKTRLQATEMSALRKIAGVTRLDCIKNEEIRCRLQQRSIVEVPVVKERRENWQVKVMDRTERLAEKVRT